MRALGRAERSVPGTPLVFDLGIHTAAITDLGADNKGPAGPAAGAVRTRIRRQLAYQQDSIIGGGAASQEARHKRTRMAYLITAARKRSHTNT